MRHGLKPGRLVIHAVFTPTRPSLTSRHWHLPHPCPASLPGFLTRIRRDLSEQDVVHVCLGCCPVALATAWSGYCDTIRTCTTPAITISGDDVFIFVGERRSERARAMGVRWEHGHLAAKPLFDALRACGIDPGGTGLTSLYDERCVRLRPCQGVLRQLARLGSECTIVAIGLRVRAELCRRGIPHLAVVHPAARGTIRRRAVYQAHVRAVLMEGNSETVRWRRQF